MISDEQPAGPALEPSSQPAADPPAAKPSVITPILSALTRIAVSLAIPFLLAAAVIKLTGHDVAGSFSALFTGSTGIDFGPPIQFDSVTGARVVAEATPLLLCGLSVALCLRAGLFNIGAAGQMTLGGFAAAVAGTTWLGSYPAPAAVIVAVVAGCLAGGLCGVVAGGLKAYRNVHEVISTIMLNYIILDVVHYFIANQFREPGSLDVETTRLPAALWLQVFVPGTDLTAGAIVAVIVLVVCTLGISWTSFGFRVRAIGAGPTAARAAGIPLKATTMLIMALGGALAGMAGAIQVLGVFHRCLPEVAGTYGFQGIAVALLANGNGFGLLVSSLFFGGLNNGATNMQLQTGVPSTLVSMVQAVVIVASALRLTRSMRR